MLTEKLQIYLCLLILFQVNEKQRRPGESRALFYFERDDQKQNSLLDDISEFLKPSVSLSELDILPLKATTTAEKKFSGNGTSSELKVCPMIPPNLHGAVKVVRPFLSDLEKTVGQLGPILRNLDFYHSMARANLNKSEELVTNTTEAHQNTHLRGLN